MREETKTERGEGGGDDEDCVDDTEHDGRCRLKLLPLLQFCVLVTIHVAQKRRKMEEGRGDRSPDNAD